MDAAQPEQVRMLLRWLKDGPPGAIVIGGHDHSEGCLQAVTWEDAGDATALALLARWHESTSALSWLRARLHDPEYILFWVRTLRGEAIGHLGLSDFQFAVGTARMCDDVLGVHPSACLMEAARRTLSDWLLESFHFRIRTEMGTAA